MIKGAFSYMARHSHCKKIKMFSDGYGLSLYYFSIYFVHASIARLVMWGISIYTTIQVHNAVNSNITIMFELIFNTNYLLSISPTVLNEYCFSI